MYVYLAMVNDFPWFGGLMKSGPVILVFIHALRSNTHDHCMLMCYSTYCSASLHPKYILVCLLFHEFSMICVQLPYTVCNPGRLVLSHPVFKVCSKMCEENTVNHDPHNVGV